MSRDSASAIPLATVGTATAEEHHRPRAKPLSQPRLSPVRVRGRELAAEALGRVLRDEETSQRSVAQVLRVSPELVQRWVDPASPKQVAIGDLVGVAVAGSPTVFFAYLDELARVLRPQVRPQRSPLEHAVQLTRAIGAASVALTETGDRSERVRALKAVRRSADDALADLEAGK